MGFAPSSPEQSRERLWRRHDDVEKPGRAGPAPSGRSAHTVVLLRQALSCLSSAWLVGCMILEATEELGSEEELVACKDDPDVEQLAAKPLVAQSHPADAGSKRAST